MTEHDHVKQLEPLPQPPGKFLVGNLTDIAGPTPILELMRLAYALRGFSGDAFALASALLFDLLLATSPEREL